MNNRKIYYNNTNEMYVYVTDNELQTDNIRADMAAALELYDIKEELNQPHKTRENTPGKQFRIDKVNNRYMQSDESKKEYYELRKKHYKELKEKGLTHLFVHEDEYPVDNIVRETEIKHKLKNYDEENELM